MPVFRFGDDIGSYLVRFESVASLLGIDPSVVSPAAPVLPFLHVGSGMATLLLSFVCFLFISSIYSSLAGA